MYCDCSIAFCFSDSTFPLIKRFALSSSVACIAFENNRIFIAKRQNVGDMGGYWEFPGGKVDEGETAAQTIQREMMEEFNVQARCIAKLGTAQFIHKEQTCTVDAYYVKLAHDGLEIPYKLTEHTEYRWVKPEEILDYQFVDSDLKLYPKVMAAIQSKKLKA